MSTATETKNRVTAAIERTREQIQDRLTEGLVSHARVETCRVSLDMETSEYCRFQELKSLAVANGSLTLEEGQTIYALLGCCPSVFNDRDCAVKSVLTRMFAELLEKNMGR
jgi:hypothetical protein